MGYKFALGTGSSNTTQEQFLSDIVAFGLREALAYIANDSRFNVDSEFETSAIGGYKSIGERFLQHAKAIRQRFQQQWALVAQGKDPSHLLEWSIKSEMLFLGGPWKDGAKQHSCSKIRINGHARR